jgi:hypothetical protein
VKAFESAWGGGIERCWRGWHGGVLKMKALRRKGGMDGGLRSWAAVGRWMG